MSLLGLSHAFELFAVISELWECAQNDKQEVQAGPGKAGGPAGASAVKCGMHCGSSCLVPNGHLRHY